MNYTLLEAVQLILSAMDSDEVNSIDDTVESGQVALLLKSVFYDIATELNLPQQETLLELNASGSSSRPTLMTYPSNVASIAWIKYDNKEDGDTHSNYQTVQRISFPDFIDMMNGLREGETGLVEMVVTQNGESFPILVRNDKFPEYYTTTNDNQLIFDSFNADVDTTLQKSKTMCHGWVFPTWTMTNSFVPPLEPAQFSYFINKAKARAFNELKQADNKEAITEARHQKLVLQKKKQITARVPGINLAPKYGRK